MHQTTDLIVYCFPIEDPCHELLPSHYQEKDTLACIAKTTVNDLAIFGGQLLFESSRPIGQLYTPPEGKVMELFRESYDARYLTNDGPLETRLESSLADFHDVEHCITVANAGLGIMMLIRLYSNGRSGEVIMPAFSYRGLPHFAQWGGQRPRFCDVDPETHGLEPGSVVDSICEKTTSILAVANFNHPGDINSLCKISHEYGIPMFIDSVYAMGSTYGHKILGSFANAEVYSLHATKLLNGFEGGYVTTNDSDLAEMLKWQRNFSLPGLTPERMHKLEYVTGINAKLNEMHAAMAMVSLEHIDEIIIRNRERYETYTVGIKEINGLDLIRYPDTEKSNYQMAVVEIQEDWPMSRDQVLEILQKEGMAISGYYSPPLHLSGHCPRDMEPPSLPISEKLALKYIQLPVGDLVSTNDVEQICDLLSFIYDNAEKIKRGLENLSAV